MRSVLPVPSLTPPFNALLNYPFPLMGVGSLKTGTKPHPLLPSTVCLNTAGTPKIFVQKRQTVPKLKAMQRKNPGKPEFPLAATPGQNGSHYEDNDSYTRNLLCSIYSTMHSFKK